MSYLVTDIGGGASEPIGMITGDFVFVGDLGRPDLLESAAGMAGIAEPSAHALWKSAKRFVQLADSIQVWPAHGAGSACGKSLGAVPQSTVGYEKANSHALKLVGSESNFVQDILSGQPEPPAYFARMKALNRDGVPLMPRLPEPRRVGTEAAVAEGTTVIDTRPWAAFRDGHLPGALQAPPGKMLPMIVGSYADPEAPILLVAEPARVPQIVRDLVRIGYDRIESFITPEDLSKTSGLVRSKEVSPQEAHALRGSALVLDVRGASEHAAGALQGSLHIAYTRLATRLRELPRDRPILVHCALGGRSAAATALLEREGFNATNVAGGFEGWRKAGVPTDLPAGARSGAAGSA
jgi:hydroxyacylglutathione hydrolase